MFAYLKCPLWMQLRLLTGYKDSNEVEDVWFASTGAASFLQGEESEASSIRRRYCSQIRHKWSVCFLTSNNRKMNQVIPDCPVKAFSVQSQLFAPGCNLLLRICWRRTEGKGSLARQLFGELLRFTVGLLRKSWKRVKHCQCTSEGHLRGPGMLAGKWSPWEQTRHAWATWGREIPGWPRPICCIEDLICYCKQKSELDAWRGADKGKWPCYRGRVCKLRTLIHWNGKLKTLGWGRTLCPRHNIEKIIRRFHGRKLSHLVWFLPELFFF